MTEKDITALMPAESEYEGWKAFVRLMRHHSYGYSALLSAWSWFKVGWEKRS